MKRLPSSPSPASFRTALARPALCAGLLLAAAGLSGCLEGDARSQLPGYIEADITAVATPVAGTLFQMGVKEGQIVKSGEKLYTLESNREQAQLAEAQARKTQAESQQQNLSKGARKDELDQVRAKLRYAKAQLAQMQTNLKKSETLVKKGFIAEAQVDSDRTAVALAQAQVEEARAALRQAKEGGRDDEKRAAAAQASAAVAGVAQVEWLLQQKQVTAPVDGVVQEIFVRQGEFAQTGASVLSILQKDSLRVRFFVPNDLRPRFLPGSQFQVKVSGCDEPLTARTTRVSARPEYTNPLMFGPELRDRLSFLTEGRIEGASKCSVPPGTPVGVVLAQTQG